ncbi:unnamed protein product [Adineta ricciae]|uniref:Peptidase S1 domain-containing protein n=1 Tax=Adineta ricciae TaxID=249248 RepID=A0A814SM37_ADIRI|nr:unnamed protein product [Adineta ricciae]
MKFLRVFTFIFLVHELSGHDITGRIYNGFNAPEDAYPWMALLRFHDMQQTNRTINLCGGSIISDIFVLTAASCFYNAHLLPNLFSIRAGVYDTDNTNTDREQIRAINRVIVHPQYNSSNLVNDLALVHVNPPFNLKAINVNVITLSNLTSVENMSLVATGWGVLSLTNATVAAIVLQDTVVQEDVACTTTKAINSTTQLCAPGTCVRDSGGPLMTFDNSTLKFELVAVTSARNACTTEGLFTRVAPFYDWISSVLKNPPPILTTTTGTTTTTGKPTEFICDPSHSCGCSSVPVVFHDNLGRIIGGETAKPHSWPWIVSIQFIGHRCGGTLINREWILTAAHCSLLQYSQIHIGIHDTTSSSAIVRNVSQVIHHPDFVPPPKHINDIALIRLSEPIDFSTHDINAATTCLPSQSNDIDYPRAGTTLAVVGWGVVKPNGFPATQLQQVRVAALENADPRCNRAVYDRERQFCAMVDGGGKDACQGDSGGPIHQWLGDHWEQVGIVSFGNGCAEAQNPGIYTRLSFYHDWIMTSINQTRVTTTASTTSTDYTKTPDNTSAANHANIFFLAIIYSLLSILAI